ncbi:hypothetical protein MNBD_GAMMA09-1904 [hydrothermal vent metagenome]|uniref:tRNA/rRNA methyltransferase SpoU type domain-containing protein n=1 Tax=hydrothermal vent metagenome TaxID=652676 RepID=A0A3B0Y0L6_9ZZZZ
MVTTKQMGAGNQTGGQALFTQQQLKMKNNRLKPAPVIICDGVQTPDNFGSILRVADAAGSNKVILLDCDIDLKSKKLSKIARSTERHLSIGQCSLQQLRQQQESATDRYTSLLALEITDQSTCLFETQLINCDAVMLGHESTGISKQALALCNQSIQIPMFGVNGSMNISHALGIFLYEWRRQAHTAN